MKEDSKRTSKNDEHRSQLVQMDQIPALTPYRKGHRAKGAKEDIGMKGLKGLMLAALVAASMVCMALAPVAANADAAMALGSMNFAPYNPQAGYMPPMPPPPVTLGISTN